MTSVTVLARETLDSFIKRYGVEPYGFLMSPRTVDILVKEQDKNISYINGTESLKFHGLPIFESMQMNDNQVRFVM